MVDVLLPELAEGVTKAIVSFWHFETGENVKEGEDLVEIVTDKATFNVPAPATGILQDVLAEEGQEVRIGEKIAAISE